MPLNYLIATNIAFVFLSSLRRPFTIGQIVQKNVQPNTFDKSAKLRAKTAMKWLNCCYHFSSFNIHLSNRVYSIKVTDRGVLARSWCLGDL